MTSLCLENVSPVAKYRLRSLHYKNPRHESPALHYQLLREFASREKQTNNMCSETECGICYRSYNLSRRCPRQLCCKHTFCESCLVTLGRSVESPEPRMMCPLCRHATPLTTARIQENLPIDEDIFDRLVTAGTVEECADDDEDTEKPNRDVVILPKEDVPPPRSRKGHLMKCLSRLCKKVTGDARRSEYFTSITSFQLACGFECL